MAVIGWMYIVCGMVAIIGAICTVAVPNSDVRFNKWIRASYLIMEGIYVFSISSLFFEPSPLVYVRIGASIAGIVGTAITMYVCSFRIKIGSKGFKIGTPGYSRAYSYEDITNVRAVIFGGVATLEITVGKRKITVSKTMQNYGRFFDKLEEAKVFLKCPIV